MNRIACVGDNCMDFYDATGESFPGGNPVNVAVYTCRMGGSASYTGAVGTDENGRTMLHALQRKGVDVSHVQVLEGATAVSHVTLKNGDRVFGEYDEGVMEKFMLSASDIDFLCTHDLVVSGLWGHAEHALARVNARGVPVVFDCADEPDAPQARTALPSVDIAFFSDDVSDDVLLQARILDVAAAGPQIVVATRGSRGSLAYDGNVFSAFGIVPCVIKDTMGAGDSFIAGFLHAWLAGETVPACMAAGASQSAVTLGYFGAW